MLKTDTQAPIFSLPNQSGETVSLEDFKGKKNVVLYFYPKDDTSGCTLEANQFTALMDEFAALDTVVMGVSKDSCDSHRAFIDKYNLNVVLISDEKGELCENYGVWQEKEKNGVKKMGIVRSTFIIDKQGQLVSVEYGVDPDGQAQAVLQKIKGMNQ
jgi:peroxiredoxin